MDEVKYTFQDIEVLDYRQVQVAISTLRQQISRIEAQLTSREAENPSWAVGARKALTLKRRLLMAAYMRSKLLRRLHGEALPTVFLRVARESLDPAIFQEILHDAKALAESGQAQ